MDATSSSGPWNGTHGSDVAHPASRFNSQPAPAPTSGNPIHTSARSNGSGPTTVAPPAAASGSMRPPYAAPPGPRASSPDDGGAPSGRRRLAPAADTLF